MDDDRFKDVIKDPKFKKIPNAAKKTKIDKRFQGMFTDEKFKIKGTKDKRGREIKISSKEDLKRFYQISDSDDNDLEKDVREIKSKKYKQPPVDPKNNLLDTQSDGDTTDTFTDEDQLEEIDHKWGELDADCPEILEATNRLAVCNMSWDLITADDLFTLFDSLKPLGGIVENIKIYQSDYGKKMKTLEDTQGPFSLIKGLCSKDNQSNISENENGDDDVEDNFDIEKLRQYQINTMKYAYAIVTCDCPQTAEHIYNQGNGIEFEKTSNLLDLRFVPDDTSFEDCQDSILSACDVEKALLSSGLGCAKPKTQFEPGSGPIFGNAKCLTQTRFDLTWDQTDPRRKKALEEDLAILYQTDRSNLDKVSKSKASKLKRHMRKRMIDSLVTDDKLELNNLLAPPSSSDEENSSSHAAPKPVENLNGKEKNKMATYREMLADVLCEKESDGENVREYSTASESEQENGDTEITWEPELQEVAKGMVDEKLRKVREEKLGPWERYLEKDKRKRSDKKRSKQETRDKPAENQNTSGGEDENTPSGNGDLELLVMSGGEDSSDSDQDLKPKKVKGKKKRKMAKGDNEVLSDAGKNENIPKNKSTFEFDDKDTRFKALLTDPRYGLDPSNPNFKMSKNVQKILDRKTKRINPIS